MTTASLRTVVQLAGLTLALCSFAVGGAKAEEKPFFPLTAWDDVRSEETIKKKLTVA